MDSGRIFELVPEIDTMMVVSQKNRQYFTGFNSTFGILLLNKQKSIFITDARYAEMAASIAGVEVRCGKSDEIDRILSDSLKELGAQNVGFEDNEITVRKFESFKELFCPLNVTLVPAGFAVNEMRLVKTPAEIEKIAEAQKITDQVFNKILRFIKEGVTEIETAVEIEYLIRQFGGDGAAFDTIVASGVNTSMPHAHPTQKKIAAGDAVTLDFGAMVGGYCADMTRTVFLGKQSPEMKNIYNVVLKANVFAIKNVRAGILAKDVDASAREILRANGLEDKFIHSLGHGLGLDVHEAPSINSKCETPLRQNMIITVEPGVYVPGVGGVRIEDMLIIKEDGCKNLTSSPKDLIIL